MTKRTKKLRKGFKMPNINKAIEAMDKACRVWSLGYDQGNRWDIRDGGECDCSSLVIWALKQGGFDTGDATYTGNLSANLTARGWKRLPPDLNTLQPGDLLLNDVNHVCMVVSGHGKDATIAQASGDENGHARGGSGGDQTGNETNERKAYTYSKGWNCILRYTGAQPTPAPAPSKPKAGIAVDGYWGQETTRALQKHFGTPCDGVVSSQYAGNRPILKACTGGFEWVSPAHGSMVVRAMQRAIGAGADGVIGRETVNALERHFGIPQDGHLSAPSNTVKRMQEALNAGRF